MIVVLVATLFISALAIAQEQGQGQGQGGLTALQAQHDADVADLQGQIDTIELTAGPAGADGADGVDCATLYDHPWEQFGADIVYNPDGVVDNGDEVVVDSNGDVGIGTTNPIAQLEIWGSLNIDAQFRSVRTGGATATFGAEQTAGVVGTNSNHPMYIRTNGVDRVTVDTDGDVGIGTVDPGAKLEVSGNIIADTPTADNHLATKAYVDAASSGGGCYVSYSGSCLSGFTNKGSAGSWGNCYYSSGDSYFHFRPPGGGCSSGWSGSPFGTAYVCCQ
jgi:hypothetical protein